MKKSLPLSVLAALGLSTETACACLSYTVCLKFVTDDTQGAAHPLVGLESRQLVRLGWLVGSSDARVEEPEVELTSLDAWHTAVLPFTTLTTTTAKWAFFPVGGWFHAARCSRVRGVAELAGGTCGVEVQLAWQAALDLASPGVPVPYGAVHTTEGLFFPSAFEAMDIPPEARLRLGWLARSMEELRGWRSRWQARSAGSGTPAPETLPSNSVGPS